MKTTVKPLYLDCDRSQVVAAWVGVAAYFMLVGWFAAWLLLHRDQVAGSAWLLPVTLLVALFLADLVSGFVHWGTDTWFDENYWTRIVSIAREHHLHPHHIVGYGTREYLAYSAWPMLLFVGPLGLLLTLAVPAGAFVFHAMTVVFIVSFIMIWGTYAHRLGHQKSPWRIVRILQRWGMLMDTRHHGVHHRDNHDIRYCVVNGWANFVCDRIGFWRGMETLIRRTTGAIPRQNDHEWWARCQPYAPRRRAYVIGPDGPEWDEAKLGPR